MLCCFTVTSMVLVQLRHLTLAWQSIESSFSSQLNCMCQLDTAGSSWTNLTIFQCSVTNHVPKYIRIVILHCGLSVSYEPWGRDASGSATLSIRDFRDESFNTLYPSTTFVSCLAARILQWVDVEPSVCKIWKWPNPMSNAAGSLGWKRTEPREPRSAGRAMWKLNWSGKQAWPIAWREVSIDRVWRTQNTVLFWIEYMHSVI